MKEAVILAAGEGERMFPYNETKPKAAIPVANTPVIKTMVNNLKQSGVERIWVVVGHLKEQIKALKKAKIKSVVIKKGIKFLLALLVGTAVTLIFNNIVVLLFL